MTCSHLLANSYIYQIIFFKSEIMTYEEFKSYCFTHSCISETETTVLILTFNYEKERHLLVWNQIIREVFSYDETNITNKLNN